VLALCESALLCPAPLALSARAIQRTPLCRHVRRSQANMQAQMIAPRPASSMPGMDITAGPASLGCIMPFLYPDRCPSTTKAHIKLETPSRTQ
jgi:hypothetical protein